MNLFVTHMNPIQIALNLDNKRLGSQLMECNHMMSLAVRTHCNDIGGDEIGPGRLVNGLSHMNHPVSVWVRQTRGNFLFTMDVAYAIDVEYRCRFGSRHASAERTDFIWQMAYSEMIPAGDLTEFQNSARHEGRGLDFTHLPVTEAYRAYLSARWKTDAREPKWSLREEPSWRTF